MGIKIADLLRWRDNLVLKDDNGDVILDDKKQPVTVYLRIIGDDDLSESYRMARIASREKRDRMNDKGSPDWKEATEPIQKATSEELQVLVRNARTSNLEAESRVAVERPELPDIEEFAVDPDAADLAEQEKLEAAIEKVDIDYEAAVLEFQQTRTKEIEGELAALSLEELKVIALEEIGTLIALGEFYAELFDQKASRGSYLDKTYREKAFDTVEEFQSSDSTIKQQIIDAYSELEKHADKVKN